jgi:very-short-patch-repair endonuclease
MPRPSRKADLEGTFAMQLKAMNLPEPKREYRFHPVRKWRFDFAYPDRKIAIEVEGGTYTRKSRHTSPIGYRQDCQKYNAANALGWHVYRGDTAMVRDGSLIAQIVEIF